MKVILQKNIQKIGEIGDVVEVKDGYARNYLLPQGLAIEATAANMREADHRKQKLLEAETEARANAEALREKMQEVKIELKTKAGEGGKLFGAITAKDIAEQLEKDHGLEIDRRKIVLEENIKALGEYELRVKLYPQIESVLKVVISTEE